jgi:hypothetical protein
MTAPKRDQIEHHVPAVLIVGGLAQHLGQLVRHQNGDQYPVTASQVCTTSRSTYLCNGPFHGIELRAFAII